MFSIIRKDKKIVKAWDRTPEHYIKNVSGNIETHLIPGPMRIAIERSGVKVELYKTATPMAINALLIWSPKNKGTLHIDESMFEQLRFLDRMVLLKLSLEIHRHYCRGDLTLTESDVVWKGEVFTGTWREILNLYNKGFTLTAMNMLGNLPWLVSGRPSRRNEESQDCHLQVLDFCTRIGRDTKMLEHAV